TGETAESGFMSTIRSGMSRSRSSWTRTTAPGSRRTATFVRGGGYPRRTRKSLKGFRGGRGRRYRISTQKCDADRRVGPGMREVLDFKNVLIRFSLLGTHTAPNVR